MFHYDLEDIEYSLSIEQSLLDDERTKIINYENLKQEIINNIHNIFYDILKNKISQKSYHIDITGCC